MVNPVEVRSTSEEPIACLPELASIPIRHGVTSVLGVRLADDRLGGPVGEA